MDDLQTYQDQLIQVKEAIEADPSNAELQTLKQELEDLITLTQSLAQRTGSSPPPSSTSSARQHDLPPAPSEEPAEPAPASPPPPPPPPQTLKAGDECSAKYSGDGRWYPARITSVSGSAKDPVYGVIFTGYNNSEMLRAHDVKSVSTPAATSSTNASSHSKASSDGKKRQQASSALTSEQEAERERKRRRNEKKSERRETKAQEASDKANSWQKFAKKGAKKGYGIAGEKSMFKTPDDPLAKVGVVGAGRGMTKSQGRSKHVYES